MKGGYKEVATKLREVHGMKSSPTLRKLVTEADKEATKFMMDAPEDIPDETLTVYKLVALHAATQSKFASLERGDTVSKITTEMYDHFEKNDPNREGSSEVHAAVKECLKERQKDNELANEKAGSLRKVVGGMYTDLTPEQVGAVEKMVMDAGVVSGESSDAMKKLKETVETKQSIERMLQKLEVVDESENYSRKQPWPDWTTYASKEAKEGCKVSDILKSALSNMPLDHPDRDAVQQRLDKILGMRETCKKKNEKPCSLSEFHAIAPVRRRLQRQRRTS
eukprot:6743428-Prymnesium_polylepis.1